MATRNLPIIDWTRIEASAPGKFIITGEYSVVYEKQAIASAIDLRTKVTIRPNNEGKVRLNLKNLDYKREWPISVLNVGRLVTKYSDCLDYNNSMPARLDHLLHPRYLDSAEPSTSRESDKNSNRDIERQANDSTIAFLLLYIGLGDSYASSARPSINVEVKSTIPVGSGLGSSSAFSVALCGALMRVYRVSAEKYIISNWALNIDKYFHGRPSGVDNSIITVGGYILFQNGKIKLNGMVKHNHPLKVMLIDTGVSRSTKELGERVAMQVRDDLVSVTSIFNNINELTTQIWRKLNDPEFTPKDIAIQLQANQELLDALGVGHQKLADICTRAQGLNLTAKQTGAGGGGIAFVLYNEQDDQKNITHLREQLVEAGYSVHDHSIGCDGLTVELLPDRERQFPLGE